LHGLDGPLKVSNQRSPSGFNRYFLDVAQACGHALDDDFNGERQDGVGHFHGTQENGERCNAARAYLAPAQPGDRLQRTGPAHHLCRGLLTSNFSESGGFLRSGPGLDKPDLQWHFVVAQADDHGRTCRSQGVLTTCPNALRTFNRTCAVCWRPCSPAHATATADNGFRRGRSRFEGGIIHIGQLWFAGVEDSAMPVVRPK
jgi:choline dehydrogenase-like flavoprotein